MSEFLIDEIGNQIWYDLKSYSQNFSGIDLYVHYPNQQRFYVRPHNDDGPSIIYKRGHMCWYINGVEYSFNRWCKLLDKTEEEINFLKLKWDIT